MKKIALFCVSYQSDKERDAYLTSVETAARKAVDKVTVDVFVANNTKDDNPGYFGAIQRLMDDVDVTSYDYTIISNVDLIVEEDFFLKLGDYKCDKNTGWIAPQIWSHLEGRDRNPQRLERPTLRKMKILKAFYQYPILDTIYHQTVYLRKKYHAEAPAGMIYAGHGSLIILTKAYFQKYRIIDYPIFLFCEELFLAENCRKAGLKVVYEPIIKVNDKEHVSVGKMSHKDYCRHNLAAMNYILQNFY